MDLQPSEQVNIPATFSTPFLYAGTVFFGVPEFVDCADAGETLLGPCRDLSVCVTSSTTNRDVVDKRLDGSNYIEGDAVDSSDLVRWFVDGICNVVALDNLYLNETMVREFGYEGPYKASSVLHSKDPLSFMTRGMDVQFGDFVDWVLRALITAEAWNITKETANQFPTTNVFGEKYENMFVDAIAAVGNYGELFARNLEEYLPRAGVNGLNYKEDTGLVYSFPFGNTKLPVDILPENLVPHPAIGGTLEAIESRGSLRCGVVGERPGLAQNNGTDLSEEWIGLDTEYCRGLCNVLFATQGAEHMAFVEFSSVEEAFEGLANGDVDLFAGAPFTLQNDVKEATTGLGFAFSPTYFYEEDHAYALATREEDIQWSDFVRWITMATFHAEEENITANHASEMPVVDLFGPSYRQALRDVVLSIGNYGQMYDRSMEPVVARAGRNLLNEGGTPQMAATAGFE